MQLLDGKEVSLQIREKIKEEVARMIDLGLRPPHLAAILVGENPASKTYVSNKEKTAKEVGILSTIYKLPETTTEKELLEVIDFLNKDEEVDGFIVQLPLPAHLNEHQIIAAIDPEKDVDGFHPVNLGKMMLGQDTFLPATPMGILEMLKHYQIETEGKHCVVIGRSHIVGTPIALLMSRPTYPGNATVTICHSKTKNLKEITLQADILIVAMGKPLFITEEYVKKDSIIIDVGIHRIEDNTNPSGYKLVGDVDFSSVKDKVSWITPVPGGVGLTTVAALLINTLKARKKRMYEK
ncbi:MAG: bifunctional methylenetetrahydrofolate dehydrogenase/methenyltetrahydrofolate cyclohydrolase FolD [Bacteroidales bacterium]|nr:bifunctional methylenetetrahydrofolate dehydrogenase/methenyltetrahydrofolate cyclohydrolase FolD [Bacteroidales bacterium]